MCMEFFSGTIFFLFGAKKMAKPIEDLTFTDDFMFGRVMQNPEICKGFLERLLEIKIN